MRQFFCCGLMIGIISTLAQAFPEVLPPLSVPTLLPQQLTLAKVERNGIRYRQLIIAVQNSGTITFRNTLNPITVLINGRQYQGSIFAKIEASNRYFKWVHIPARHEGAVIVDLPATATNKGWQQCESLAIQLDPHLQLQHAVAEKNPNPVVALRLHRPEFSSSCNHLPG